MVERVNLEAMLEDAMYVFHHGYTCAETVVYTLRKHFGWEAEMNENTIAMSSGFPWGLGGVGCLCGAVAGGTMCLGFCFGRTTPGDPCVNRCFELTCEFGNAVVEKFGSCCCGKLIEEFPDRNGADRKAKCAELVKFCLETAARIIAREKGIVIE